MLTSAHVSFTHLHSEPNENPPEFTLTCRSVGGPATTVMWQRNGEPVQEDSNHETSQIIADTSENTVYKNTLRVRGREERLFTCNVSNNIQDFISDHNKSVNSSIIVKGIYCSIAHNYNLYFHSFLLTCTFTVAETPTQLIAIYKSTTSILLTWTYASSTQTTTGYRYAVYYEYAGGRNRRYPHVSSGVNTYLLSQYPKGGIYNISIVAVRNLPSDVVGPVDPGLCRLDQCVYLNNYKMFCCSC